jgi:O-antigen biosynthesis protein
MDRDMMTIDPTSPKFSVVVTTHNRPALLREAIASVLAQTITDFELLVVDDGGARPVHLNDVDPRVRLIRRDRAGGPAAARNTGIAASRGAYLTFLDDDDLFLPNRLAIADAGIHAGPIVVCESTRLDERARPWIDAVRAILSGDDPRRRAHLRRRPIELFPQVGQVTALASLVPRFDERLRVEEDVDWWVILTRSQTPVVVHERGYIRRTTDRARVRSPEDLTRALNSTLLVLSKNQDFFAEHPSAAALRWRRIALFYERLGQGAEARAAFRRAALISGANVRQRDILRSYLPIPTRLRTRM